jgi:putative ABC transport system permease protein
LPFFGGGDGNIFAAEGSEPKSNEPVPTSWWRDVSPGYFKTMGIPIIRGRAFQASDSETSLRVAIVDENFARANWPNGDPIGKRIHFAWGGPSMTVVGVAASIKHRRLDEDAATYVYWPTSQDIQDSMYLVVRTTVKPSAITSSVRAQVSALDADLPLFEVTTMEEAVARSLGTRRLTSSLLIGFAVTALLLASLGVYGVTSLNVGSRTNEFGIRLALGAQAKDLLKLVLSQAALLALTGAAIGLIASFAVGRFISTLLYGVNATDPLTFFSIALLLVIISLLACWLPARRAAKVDPLLALRRE